MQVGVDIGGSKIEAALVDGNKVLKKVRRLTEAEKGIEIVLNNIANAIADVFTAEVEAIGVGVAGPVDPTKSVMTKSPHIPCLVEFPLKVFLEKKFKVKVAIDNDARMFTLGVSEFEYAGVKNLVGLTLGTGVGGTAVIDGKMEDNPRDASDEIGHLVIEEHGRRCACGARGCIEAYTSGGAIEARYRELGGGPLDVKAIAERVARGDDKAKQALEDAGYYLAKGFVKILEKYRPEVIAIGGGVAEAEDIIRIAKREFRRMRPDAKVKISKSKLEDASMLGAARFATRG